MFSGKSVSGSNLNAAQKMHPLVDCLNLIKNLPDKPPLVEQMALIRLVSYHGRDGKIYPSIKRLADELGVSERYVQLTLTKMEKRGLIRRHFNVGSTTSYEINFAAAQQNEKVLNKSVVDELTISDQSYPQMGEQKDQSYPQGVNYSSPPPRTIVHPSPEPWFTLTEYLTEKENSVGKGLDKKRPALTLNHFLPSEENKRLAIELALDITDQVERFKNRYRGKGKDLHFEFDQWLKDSRAFLDRQGKKTEGSAYKAANDEVRSIVPEFNEAHPAYEASKTPRGDAKTAAAFMEGIRRKLGRPSKTPPAPQRLPEKRDIQAGAGEVAIKREIPPTSKFDVSHGKPVRHSSDAYKLSTLYGRKETTRQFNYIQ